MNRSLEQIALELLGRFKDNAKALILKTSRDADRDLRTLEYEVGLYLDAIRMASARGNTIGGNTHEETTKGSTLLTTIDIDNNTIAYGTGEVDHTIYNKDSSTQRESEHESQDSL